LYSHYIADDSSEVTRRAHDRSVSATFYNLAPTFDAHLRSLAYNATQMLAALVQAHADESLDVLDLGCGTGQCRLALAQQKRYLIGVDLSEKMLAQARAHGVYDELHLGEVHKWLRG